jgi:hypothetical protein
MLPTSLGQEALACTLIIRRYKKHSRWLCHLGSGSRSVAGCQLVQTSERIRSERDRNQLYILYISHYFRLELILSDHTTMPLISPRRLGMANGGDNDPAPPRRLLSQESVKVQVESAGDVVK